VGNSRYHRAEQVSFASTYANNWDIGCGMRMRTVGGTSALVFAEGDFADPQAAGSAPCAPASMLKVCADGATLQSTASLSDCAALQAFATANMTNVSLWSENLVARAASALQAPGIAALTSFNVMAAA
jgi:hypothetical protein